MANAVPFVKGRLDRNQVVVFSKSYSSEGRICQKVLKDYNEHLPDNIFEWINIEKRSDCSQVEDYLWLLSGKNNREVPLMFVKQRFMGGYHEIIKMHTEGTLEKLLKGLKLDNSLIEDEDDDDDVEKKKEISQVTVRVQELDDTEVMVKVTDLLDDDNCQPDYDMQLKKAGSLTLPELLVLFRQTIPEKTKDAPPSIELQQQLDEGPEWFTISGKEDITPNKASTISRETSHYVLKKASRSQPSAQEISTSIVTSAINVPFAVSKSREPSRHIDLGSGAGTQKRSESGTQKRQETGSQKRQETGSQKRRDSAVQFAPETNSQKRRDSGGQSAPEISTTKRRDSSGPSSRNSVDVDHEWLLVPKSRETVSSGQVSSKGSQASSIQDGQISSKPRRESVRQSGPVSARASRTSSLQGGQTQTRSTNSLSSKKQSLAEEKTKKS